MGVNDLPAEYDEECRLRKDCEPYRSRGRTCPECPAREAEYIRDIAREAWNKPRAMGGREPHPFVDGSRVVAGTYSDGEWQELRICFYDEVHGQEWFAAIESVILLPEGEGS